MPASGNAGANANGFGCGGGSGNYCAGRGRHYCGAAAGGSGRRRYGRHPGHSGAAGHHPGHAFCHHAGRRIAHGNAVSHIRNCGASRDGSVADDAPGCVDYRGAGYQCAGIPHCCRYAGCSADRGAGRYRPANCYCHCAAPHRYAAAGANCDDRTANPIGPGGHQRRRNPAGFCHAAC